MQCPAEHPWSGGHAWTTFPFWSVMVCKSDEHPVPVAEGASPNEACASEGGGAASAHASVAELSVPVAHALSEKTVATMAITSARRVLAVANMRAVCCEERSSVAHFPLNSRDRSYASRREQIGRRARAGARADSKPLRPRRTARNARRAGRRRQDDARGAGPRGDDRTCMVLRARRSALGGACLRGDCACGKGDGRGDARVRSSGDAPERSRGARPCPHRARQLRTGRA